MTALLVSIPEEIKALLVPVVGAVPIVLGHPIVGTPDQFIGLVAYRLPNADRLSNGQVLIGLNVRLRVGAREGLKALLDLEDLINQTVEKADPVASARVAWLQSQTPALQDEKDRPEMFDTYYVRADFLGLTG